MKNRLIEGLSVAFTCFIITLALNELAWVIIQYIASMKHNYEWYELILSSFIYSLLVLLFVVVLGKKVLPYSLPLIYLFLSIIVLFRDYFSGYELLYLLNFDFSQLSYIVYNLIRDRWIFNEKIYDIILFNSIFFFYQVILLHLSTKYPIARRS